MTAALCGGISLFASQVMADVFAGAAVLGSAFICGARSNPNHRYQGRMVWLAAGSAAMLVFAQTAAGRVRRRAVTA